jgi:hypothetical protein
MPQWLSISLGILLGVAVLFGAAYLAIRPYVQAKPPKPIMPERMDGAQDWGASNGGMGGDGSNI